MGGSGGHMRHPHDLDEVEAGKDIIALFRAIPDYLRSEEFTSGKGSSLKLDGSNNAIKVVQREDGKIQFAIDRGSHSALDVNGVTLDKLKQRFTKVKKNGEVKSNDGLARSSAGLINMMQETYDSNPERVEAILRNLTLIDENGVADPTKFINIEYIQRKEDDINPETGLGRANAIYYSFDSITFLNISQYYQVVRKGVVKRPGAERPTIKAYAEDGTLVDKISTDVSVSIKFEPNVLDELAELCRENAPLNSTGTPYAILGPGDLGIRVDHELGDDASERDIASATQSAINQLQKNIEYTLNSKLTIRISDERPVTKSLKNWLEMAVNFPYKPDITLVDGSKKGPFTKWMHDQLIDRQVPLDNIVPIGEEGCDFSGALDDCEKAVYGAIFYEAARRLGNTVKQSLITKYDKFGNTVDQEGVVINPGMRFGDKTTSNVFKITGEFIVDGNKGVYAVRESSYNLSTPFTIKISNETSITKSLQEWLLEAANAKHTYQKLPSFVFEDIMSGKAIVDIVEQENASQTIYNAVYEHVNSLLEKKGDFPKDKHKSDPYPPHMPRLGEQDEHDEDDDDFLITITGDDEDGDPVGPIGGGMTYALVPGSFKPAHLGHVYMIAQYAEMVNKIAGDNGKVLVLVSEPENPKNERPLPNGKIMKRADAEAILELYLGAVGNVEIVPVTTASPISAVYDFLSPKIGQIRDGDHVILGASTKGGDSDRWKDIINNADKRVMPGATVDSKPVDPYKHGDDYVELITSDENSDILKNLPTKKKKGDISDLSASDARYLMSFLGGPRHEMAVKLLYSFFGDRLAPVLARLDLPHGSKPNVDEMSSVGGGHVTGGAGGKHPFRSSSRRKKRTNVQEIISNDIIEEVMDLIIDKGIIL